MRFIILLIFILYNTHIYANENTKIHIIARVKDEIILNTDLDDRIKIFKILSKKDFQQYFKDKNASDPEIQKDFSKKIEDLLVNEMILEIEAKNINLQIGKQEIYQWLINKYNYKNAQEIEQFILDNNLNSTIFMRAIKFEILKEKFLIELIFYNQDVLSDDEIKDELNYLQILEDYYYFRIINKDIIAKDNIGKLNCDDLLKYKFRDVSLASVDLSDDLYQNFAIEKHHYIIDEKRNEVIMLCKIENNAAENVDLLYKMRVIEGMQEFFAKMRHRYVEIY